MCVHRAEIKLHGAKCQRQILVGETVPAPLSCCYGDSTAGSGLHLSSSVTGIKMINIMKQKIINKKRIIITFREKCIVIIEEVKRLPNFLKSVGHIFDRKDLFSYYSYS